MEFCARGASPLDHGLPDPGSEKESEINRATTANQQVSKWQTMAFVSLYRARSLGNGELIVSWSWFVDPIYILN